MPSPRRSSIARLWERQRASAVAALKAPPPSPPTRPPGAWPLADLREGQCRFACTPFDAARDAHRFCGLPVSWLKGKPTSWCAQHLPRVIGAPGFSAGGPSLADMEHRRGA